MTPMLHEQTQTVVNAKTAVYLRFWKDMDGETPDRQGVELLRYCSTRGWVDLEIFTDHARGGKSSRPALEKLMRKIRSGEVTRVVCHTLETLGRSLTHLCSVIEELTRLQVPLLCVAHDFDTMQEPCAKVMAAMCQFRRSMSTERVVSGLAAARGKGVRLGRPSTLNEHRDDVLELRGQGKGIREIARELKMPVASVFKVIKEAK